MTVVSRRQCRQFSHKLLTNFMEQILPEKLIGPELVKKFPAFYGTEGSLPHSQAPATCPYPEPDQPSICLPIPLLENPF